MFMFCYYLFLCLANLINLGVSNSCCAALRLHCSFCLLAVAIVGGLMINRRIGGDFFQPMSFETCTKDSKHIDLFETAFGERPNLVPILGSEEAVERLFVGGSKK